MGSLLLLIGSGYLLVVHPAVPAHTVRELIALAKNPDKPLPQLTQLDIRSVAGYRLLIKGHDPFAGHVGKKIPDRLAQILARKRLCQILALIDLDVAA